MNYEKVLEFWNDLIPQSVSELEKLLDNFRILFAYHSGKIENENITYSDTREIFENGVVQNYSGSPRAIFEQQNQKLCYDFLKQKIIDKEPLNIALILQIHNILTAGTYDGHRYIENGERPGEFKKHDYITGIHEVGSPAGEVEKDIEELIEELNDFQGEKSLKAGTYLHAKFEYIHPFADGNGRVGRMLLNYFLMTHEHPPLIVFDKDKQLYYTCLQKYDEEENLEPLFEFLKYETEQTWKRTIEIAEKSEPRKGLDEYI